MDPRPVDEDPEPVSEHESDEDDEQPNRGGAHLTIKHREWVFLAICQARGKLNITTWDTTLTTPVMSEALSILWRARQFSGLTTKPNVKTLRRIWNAFHNSTASVSHGLKRQSKRPPQLIPMIVDILSHHPKATTREIFDFLPPGLTSHTTVWRIMRKDIHLFFYRRRKVQMLRDVDLRKRNDFSRMFSLKLQRMEIGLERIIFSDEMMIGVNKFFNRQNDGKWEIKGQQDELSQMIERKSFDNLVHMWVGLSYQAGIIGPYFIDELYDPDWTDDERGKTPNSLTGAKYRHLIQYHVLPVLYSRVSETTVRESYWWQQDGAGPHRSDEPLRFLRSVFGTRLIALKSGDFEWPSRSPDLNPLDYSFWSLMRKKISEADPKDKDEIKRAALNAKSSLNPIVKRIIADLPVRLRACIEVGGHPFDPWLKQYKKRISDRDFCARCADEADELLCNECNNSVIRAMQRDRQLAAQQEARDEAGYDDDDDDVMQELNI